MSLEARQADVILLPGPLPGPYVIDAVLLLKGANEMCIQRVILFASGQEECCVYKARHSASILEYEISSLSESPPNLLAHLAGIGSSTEINIATTLLLPALATSATGTTVCVDIPATYIHSGDKYLCTSCPDTVFSSSRAFALHLLPQAIQTVSKGVIDVDTICTRMI